MAIAIKINEKIYKENSSGIPIIIGIKRFGVARNIIKIGININFL